MPVRIEIKRLKDGDDGAPNILGSRVTILIPDNVPALAETHRALVNMADQAPLYIAVMSAAAHLFPTGQKSGGQHDKTKTTPP